MTIPVKRPVVEIATAPQMRLFDIADLVVEPGVLPRPGVRFTEPDPRELYFGGLRVDEFLQSMGQGWTLKVRAFLLSLDYGPFAEKYKGGGRPPYAPVLMVGLVLYGIMKGVSSLRDLEVLARVDLGAMWIAGGIAPDHSVLGRFLNLHREVLTESYFEDLTRKVLKETGGDAKSVAGDGTVVQAAASRYGTLKAEAAAQAAREARERAEQDASNVALAARAKQAELGAKVAAEREESRRANGRESKGGVVSPSEPEAVIQPLKTHAVAPSYKPSILANDQRIIVGCTVEPSSEIAAVKPMLEQAERIGGEKVEQALFDAGYRADEVITISLEKDIDLLCPEGKAKHDDDWEKNSDKQFPKSRFIYDETQDTYRCPANETLVPFERYKGNEKFAGYTKYRTPFCAECPLKAKCTKSEQGRTLKRLSGDEAKDALRQVMTQEGARKRYRKRQAMVEPVFSELKREQGLERFRRRGLVAVRLEFALHACAHNLRRMLAIGLSAATARLAALLVVLILLVFWSYGHLSRSVFGRKQHRDVTFFRDIRNTVLSS